MGFKDFLSLAGPLVGVALGWWLNQRSSREQRLRERRQRSDELRLATYAEWTAGIEAQFIAYARQQGGAGGPDVALCEKRLLLLETNADIRALIQAVRDAFPNLGSEDQRELEMIANADPEWEWTPFRDAMNRLLGRVRDDLAARA